MFNCLNGWVDYWHTNQVKDSLQEFLGFDEEDCKFWINNNDEDFKSYINKKYKNSFIN